MKRRDSELPQGAELTKRHDLGLPQDAGDETKIIINP